MSSPCKKHSGLFGLANKVNRFALPLVAALGLMEGRALSQGVQPNDVGIPNPNHEVSVVFSGPCAYSNSWNGQSLPAGAPFMQVLTFNPDRFLPDPTGGYDDRWGTISFSTSPTNSVATTNIYYEADTAAYGVTWGSISGVDLYGGIGSTQVSDSDGDLKAGLHIFTHFPISSSYLDQGIINGPTGINGGLLRANVTNVTVSLAGRPILSMSLSGTNTVLTYPVNDAIAQTFTLYSKTADKLGTAGGWTAVTNAVESTYKVSTSSGTSIIDQFIIPSNPAMVKPNDVVIPTNQIPSNKFYMLGL